MKTLRRIISLLMSLALLLSICACDTDSDKDTDKENISSGGGYSSTTSSDYDSTVSGWQEETNGEDEEFDKPDSDTPATTPGSSTQQTVVNVTRPVTPETETNKPVRGSVLASGLPFSELTDESELQYIYKGKNYAYGITKDNKEYIAYRDEFGDMVDVFNGPGRAVIKNTSSATILATGNMTDWTETMLDSWHSIVTHYVVNVSGGSNQFFEVAYVFKENSISVSVKVRVNSETPLADGSLSRAFVNVPKATSTRVNETWEYPISGDQAYQKFESLTFRNQISDDIYAYTFLRTVGQRTEYNVEGMNGSYLPIEIQESETDLVYGVNVDNLYDISFVDTSVDKYQGGDYLALFRSWDSQFAAGVALAEATDDSSTIVEGNSVKLNLNVTNLIEEDLKYSLRYDVRNHYGDVVDAGVFIDNTVYKYADANRSITVGGKYGMYYLNLYVISEHSTYREMFPFALIPEYEYKYWETNPFGVNSVNCNKNNESEWIGSGRLQAKVGTANYRIGNDGNQFIMAKEMIKHGSHRFVGGLNVTEAKQGSVDSWTNGIIKSVDNMVKVLGEDLDYIEIGNEFNLKALSGDGPSESELYPIWYEYMFKPSYDAITAKYPELTYMPTPDSACSPSWLNWFVDGYVNAEGKRVGKVWDLVDIVDTHIYGTPWMPDSYSIYNVNENTAPNEGLWHIEQGMRRMDQNLKRLNPTDPTKTDFMLTEVGYTSRPWGNSVDQRTQADYTARIGAICLGYGADMVQYYCMYDRTSYSTGNSENGEWHFGLFHEHDYYGIIKPKTSGIAFAIMTRILESYKKNSGEISSKYDEGFWNGGVRAFSFDTDLKGKVIMAWSNAEVLPNGKKRANGTVGDRLPTLQWENQWKQTDPTSFEVAKGGTLEIIDLMGNSTKLVDDDNNGEITVELTGSPVYIIGVK